MNLHEIENLSYEELKSRREELSFEAAQASPDDLGERFVSARIDAKLRDTKLAQQAETLAALQAGMGAMQARLERLAQDLDNELAARRRVEAELESRQIELDSTRLTYESRLAQCETERRQTVADWQARYDVLLRECEAQRARADRFKSLASKNHVAIGTAAKALNEAVSAAAIEAADHAEGA